MPKSKESIKLLAKAIHPKTKPQESLQIIQSFRQELSLSWLEEILKSRSPLENLIQVWNNLFELLDNSDINVRIAAFSALGALISNVASFHPQIASDSFKQAFPSIEFTANKSVSLIACYLYLVNFLPFQQRTQFIESVNILPHFSVDTSEFIDHIPHLIPLMKPLETDFHKAFLRSIIVSFTHSQKVGFPEAILEMVKLNPSILINDSIEFFIQNNAEQPILSIGSTFLQDSEIFPFLGEKNISFFESKAMEVLKNKDSQVNEIEKSVNIIASLFKMSRQVSNLNELDFSQYPKHIQKFTIQIDPNIQHLKIDDQNDSQFMKQSKLKALMHVEDAQFVLSVLENFSELNEKGDTFTTFVNSFQLCFNKIKNVDHELIAKLISKILFTTTETWVEQNAIVDLIGEIGNDGALFMNDFEETSINFLLKSCFSSCSQLVLNSIEKLCKLATHNTLNIIINYLYTYDFFDTKAVFRFLLILNALVKEFGPEHFIPFNHIVKEVVLYHQTINIIGHGFSFLRKIGFEGDEDLLEYGFNWISLIYHSYTQQHLGISNDDLLASSDIVMPNILTIVETDILSNNLMLKENFIPKSMFSIFKFLICRKHEKSIAIFPQMIRLNPNLIKFYHVSPDEILKVFNESCTYKTASLACDEIETEIEEIIPIIEKLIDQLLLEKDICVSYLASFFRLIINNTEYKNKIKAKLSESEFILFEMKLKQNVFSLTQHQFNSLPVSELNIDSIEKPIVINDLDSLDFSHLRFVFENESFFEIKNQELIQSVSNMSFQKLEVDKTFTLNAFEKNTAVSATFDIFLQGKMPTSIPLINSFFAFNDLPCGQEIFDEILSQLIEKLRNGDKSVLPIIDSAIRYSLRCNLIINDDHILYLLEYETLLKNLILKVNENNKEKILKEIYKKLNIADGSTVLINATFNDNTFTIYDFVVVIDIRNQFHLFFKDHFRLKKEWLKKLCYWVQTFSYADSELIDFIQSIFKTIDQVKSTLKLLYVLRLVYCFVYLLTKNQTISKNFNSEQAISFLTSLFSFFNPIWKSDIDTLHIETSSIFYYASLYIRLAPPIISFFDNFDNQFKTSSIYLKPMATAFIFSSIPSLHISKAELSQLLTSELPSNVISALKVMQLLLHPQGTIQCFYLLDALFPTFYSVVARYKTAKGFASLITNIFNKMLHHPLFNSMKTVFIPNAIETVFSINPASSSFFYYSAILPNLFYTLGLNVNYGDNLSSVDDYSQDMLLNPQCMQISPSTLQCIVSFMETISNSPDFYQMNIPQIFSNCCDYLITHELRKKAKRNQVDIEIKVSELLKLKLKKMTQFLLISPNSSTRKLFLQTILQNFDVFDRSFYLIAKIPFLGENFLQSYVLISNYLKICTDKDKEDCDKIFNDNKQSYISPKMIEALSDLLDGKIIEGGVLAAFCNVI